MSSHLASGHGAAARAAHSSRSHDASPVSLAVFAALTIALFVLPRSLTRNNPGRWAGLTALAGLVALVVLAALLSGVAGDVGGLLQRAFVALVLGWPVLLAALPGRTALP